MKNDNFKILIITGIYPPKIGGPAQYAKEVRDGFVKLGHSVKVLTFNIERYLPTGFRHFWFFIKVVSNIINVDFILALDTFSVGFPGVLASKIFGKKIIIRTGGDFLWEGYVERTGDLVLLKDFYKTRVGNLNFKEKIIFKITKWTLQNCSALIFSTKWQQEIFEPAYDLDSRKSHIVENFYGKKKAEIFESEKKVFLASTRPLKWKNIATLKESFKKAQSIDPTIELDLDTAPYDLFLEKIKKAYALILVSLGDISPNMILDGISLNKPFILTKENGIINRIENIGVFVDPHNIEDIKEKILFLSNKENYTKQQKLVESFNFYHSWDDICEEILNIAKNK